MTAKVLLNPYACRSEAQKRWPEVDQALRAADIDFEVDVSQSASHLQDLARRAALDGYAPIIIAGGDGTIGIALNGLASGWDESGSEWGPLGIIPLGTANDLAANIGLPVDLDAAVRVIAEGHIRPLDVCQVNGRYFLNNTAIGMEATIAWRQNRMVWAKGIWRYILAALQEFFLYPQWEARLEWDDGVWQGPVTMISVGNGRRTGGVYFTVPGADPFDGLLTFAVARGVSRWHLVSLMRAVMDEAHPYTETPDAFQHHTAFLQVDLQPPSPSHADGEIFTAAETHFEYRVLPGKLQLYMPA